ncbi:hypothetical protein MGYG_05515 [Nannizzia gypsea CBS 118893]|uniref:Uncharacterized protein n=1 Tax=Arthroderma gypseum (strain ATCC MYA-4604 / CBS 118893) TaxID=535722 RepID=E4UWC4_ARTGP|nr:hypothetical protein MGYG_05515 [Nannizzia gypsea CBS 118893]EFR02519.1 hypothetical protein MGYG_05515 [Nannizzia gypsea CBS 118893]
MHEEQSCGAVVVTLAETALGPSGGSVVGYLSGTKIADPCPGPEEKPAKATPSRLSLQVNLNIICLKDVCANVDDFDVYLDDEKKQAVLYRYIEKQDDMI